MDGFIFGILRYLKCDRVQTSNAPLSLKSEGRLFSSSAQRIIKY